MGSPVEKKNKLPWMSALERAKLQMDREAGERKLRKAVEEEEQREAVAALEKLQATRPLKPPPLPIPREDSGSSARRALVRDLMDGVVGDTIAVGRDGMRREDASPFGIRRVWRPRRGNMRKPNG